MGLDKLHINTVGSILERMLKSYNLFLDFILNAKNTQKISTPTKITEYNFSFISKKNKREIYIRIQDFYSYQKLIFWIRNNENKQLNKIDVELFFIECLMNKGIKQQLIFKSKLELENNIKNI